MDEKFISNLWAIRSSEAAALPSGIDTRKFLDRILSVLYPQFSEHRFVSQKEVECELSSIKLYLASLLNPLESNLSLSADKISYEFFEKLPHIYEMLSLDAEAICEGDPAATCVNEVIAAYPGFFAVASYRIAHDFYLMGAKVFSRIITEYAHRISGVDIHPGAQIGKSFCIDHGTGIVIGETTEIDDNVKLYQGVTLGALSVDKSCAEKKRHPTIGKGVVIYSNATILGGETVIGDKSIIGGNVWLTSSIPANSTVYHKGDVTIHNKK